MSSVKADYSEGDMHKDTSPVGAKQYKVTERGRERWEGEERVKAELDAG